jgi:hypothetical protein
MGDPKQSDGSPVRPPFKSNGADIDCTTGRSLPVRTAPAGSATHFVVDYALYSTLPEIDLTATPAFEQEITDPRARDKVK